jgi:hypothetical protein
MKKLVVINRNIWVGGKFCKPGDIVEVPDQVGAEMCGALKTGRLFDPIKDAPAPPPAPAKKKEE